MQLTTVINTLYQAVTINDQLTRAQKLVLHNIISSTNQSITILFNVSALLLSNTLCLLSIMTVLIFSLRIYV